VGRHGDLQFLVLIEPIPEGVEEIERGLPAHGPLAAERGKANQGKTSKHYEAPLRRQRRFLAVFSRLVLRIISTVWRGPISPIVAQGLGAQCGEQGLVIRIGEHPTDEWTSEMNCTTTEGNRPLALRSTLAKPRQRSHSQHGRVNTKKGICFRGTWRELLRR